MDVKKQKQHRSQQYSGDTCCGPALTTTSCVENDVDALLRAYVTAWPPRADVYVGINKARMCDNVEKQTPNTRKNIQNAIINPQG